MSGPAGGRLLAMIVCVVCVQFCGAPACAHELQPGYLELRLIDTDLYAVVWKTPAQNGRPMAISARLPDSCVLNTPGQPIWDGSAFVSRWTTRCPGGLDGGVINIEGLEQTSTDVLVRFELPGGGSGVQRLTASRPSFTVPSRPGTVEVAGVYFRYGVGHILSGADHLLFVLALLFLVQGWKRVVGTITAFTVAHSITLAAATFGGVHVPGPPVEAVIALSIVFVAAEIIHGRQGRPGAAVKWPWLVAFAFGLLHGFGFAGALSDVGLPQQAIPLALFFFNVGVEVGQLLFVALVALTMVVVRRMVVRRPRWIEIVPPYAIGTVAMFWVFERLAAF